MSIKKIILHIILSTVLLPLCSAHCFAQSRTDIDSLLVRFDEAAAIIDNGDFPEAKVALTHVMQGAARLLQLHPEANDEIQALRLMCIRYFTVIAREQDDMDAAEKWVANGRVMASKHLSSKEDARYWNTIFRSEQKVNDEHAAEKERKYAQKKKMLFWTTATATVLAVLLFILSYLFLNLRRAYRFLVKKNEEMAQEVLSPDKPDKILEKDTSLTAEIVRYMTQTKAYLNPDLSLNDLCRQFCTNRTYMSNAFSEMGTNFNAFVNKYRVSEAIRLLSEKPEFSLQDIWPVCGFNSQSTFYSSFKNITGLTPAQFRKGKY